MSTIYTQLDQVKVVMRVDDPLQLNVHGANGALVPLTSLVRLSQIAAPLEVLHRAQLPDVDLEVRGDPRQAIGLVPAGVRVEVDSSFAAAGLD